MAVVKQRDKGGGWIGKILLIALVVIAELFGSAHGLYEKAKTLADDNRVRFMQLYHLDSTCQIRRFILNEGGRFNDQFIKISFKTFNGDDDATECQAAHHNVFSQHEGQYVVTLSNTVNGLRTIRRGVNFDGGVPSNEKGIPEQAVVGVLTFEHDEEADATIEAKYCFLDLETTIVCAIKLTNGKYVLKRFFIDFDGSVDSSSHGINFRDPGSAFWSQLQHDPISGHLALTHYIGRLYDVRLRHMYAANNHPTGDLAVMHAPGNKLKGICTYGPFRYILTNPGYDFGPGTDTDENTRSSLRTHAIFRGFISNGVQEFDSLIGMQANGTLEEIHTMFDRVDGEEWPLLGEGGSTVALKVFMNSTYPLTGGHGKLQRQVITNKEECAEYKKQMESCMVGVAGIMLQQKIGVLLTVIVTVTFILLLAFLLCFAVFCIKERRRRHRRKKRKAKKPKKAPAVSSDPNKKDEAVDVEMDPNKNPVTAGALAGPDEESEKKEKGGYFAQQMRRLTKMDEDDEFEQPDAAAAAGAANESTDVSNYVLAQDRFDAPNAGGVAAGAPGLPNAAQPSPGGPPAVPPPAPP